MSVQSAWKHDRPFALYGRAPRAAARVVATLANGRSAAATVAGDGWYVLVLPPGSGREAGAKITAISASGKTLARISLGTS